MNTILFLEEKSESADRVSRALQSPTRHEGDATPGCTCDRWGHPRPDCVEPKPQPRTTLRQFSLVKK